MGRAKEWMLEQLERGHSEADGDICAQCVSEPFLAKWVEGNVSATACSFCGRKSKDPIAASFDGFVGAVMEGIAFDWNHPDDEGIMYISAEGGYQAPISNNWEVLSNYDISENDAVFEALVDAIDDNGWVERDFYWGDESQRLKWGWDSFKYITKHKTRYLFLKPDADDRDDFPPSEMLDVIGSVINSKRAPDLFKIVAKHTDIFRIRIGQEGFGSAAAIGPPPEEFAIQPNRMSPSGIPMFYGALDANTAKAETFDPAVHAGQIMSIGKFRPVRDLKLINLADLPDVPSVFDGRQHPLIHPMRFLHSFSRDLVEPIARDGREHIEYVPTQIVTEYFRLVFRDSDSQPIDGLIYQSSKNGAGRAVVLFCENEGCVDVESGSAQELLRLVAVDYEPCP